MMVHDICIEVHAPYPPSLSEGPLVISRARDFLYKCYDRKILTLAIISTFSQEES